MEIREFVKYITRIAGIFVKKFATIGGKILLKSTDLADAPDSIGNTDVVYMDDPYYGNQSPVFYSVKASGGSKNVQFNTRDSFSFNKDFNFSAGLGTLETPTVDIGRTNSVIKQIGGLGAYKFVNFMELGGSIYATVFGYDWYDRQLCVLYKLGTDLNWEAVGNLTTATGHLYSGVAGSCVYDSKIVIVGFFNSNAIYTHNGTIWGSNITVTGIKYGGPAIVYDGDLYFGGVYSTSAFPPAYPRSVFKYNGIGTVTLPLGSYAQLISSLYSNATYLYTGVYNDGITDSYTSRCYTWNGSVSAIIFTKNFFSINAIFEYGGAVYIGGTYDLLAGAGGAGCLYKQNGGSWDTITEALGTGINCLCAYNGLLYIGTTGGIVYTYNGADLISFFDTGLDRIDTMNVISSKLYIGAGWPSSCYVYDSAATETTIDPILTISRSGPGVPNDNMGSEILFRALNSNRDIESVAKIDIISTDVTEDTEDAKMDFYTITNGVLSKCLTLENSSTTLPSGKLGGVSNYTNFDTSGRQTMAGTARVLKETIMNLEGIGRGTTASSIVRVGNTYGYGFTIGDDGYLQFEVPSDWDPATDIDIYLHAYINETYATNNGEVRFQATYTCVAVGESVITPAHSGTLDSGDINIPASVNLLMDFKLGTIPFANLAPHDMVLMLISRIALVAGNNPAAEPVLIHIEIEHIANSLGYVTV